MAVRLLRRPHQLRPLWNGQPLPLGIGYDAGVGRGKEQTDIYCDTRSELGKERMQHRRTGCVRRDSDAPLYASLDSDRLSAEAASCVVAMSAYGGAHHLRSLFIARGYEDRLMSPEYVHRYVKAHQNNDLDAEGIGEAAFRPTMHFVDLNSEEQLDIQTLHAVGSRLVAERTNLINQLHAVPLERSVSSPASRRKIELRSGLIDVRVAF